MALVFMEGFADRTMSGKWDSGSVLYTVGNSSPRTDGGYYAQMVSNSLLTKYVTASNKLYIGCGWRKTATNANSYASFYGDNGTVQHISVVHVATTGTIQIRRGAYNGTLLAESSSTISINTWFYIEVSVTISDTIGEVHVRLNGETTDFVSFTGDTKNGGTNTTIDNFRFLVTANSLEISDLYVLDDTGSSNNDFLGDVAVRTLSPDANGNSSQLTGSDGNQTDNYLLVDEKPFSTTDYTYSSTSGHKDTYGMADLPATASTVFGVQVNASMRKDDAGLGQARYVLRSGGTDYVGSTETLTTTATTYVGLYEQDPATASAWTVSGVNSAEAGMEVV